jgi:hypothetical protein
MKKIIALLAVSALIVSCTNNEIETVENNDENTGVVEQTTTNENIPEANEETNTGSEIEENQITEEEFEETSNT